MTSALRSLWAEPRPPRPPRRVWRDWALVIVLVPTAVLESLLREDLAWNPVGLLVTLSLISAVLWRRTHPLTVVVIVWGVMSATSVLTLFTGEEPGLYTMGWALVLVYSLLRWGSGREVMLGLPVVLLSGFLGLTADATALGEAVAGMAFLMLPAAIGAAVRYGTTTRARDLEQVRLREREQLARELHDTVAHHISAIIIQAQAGRTLAESHPTRAAEALEVIEEAASRTLAEMRTMVGVLRDNEEAAYAPQRGVADITRLAVSDGEWPRVDVELSGDLDDLSPTLGAAIYRLAQESVTNASRHARNATRITVSVAGDRDCIRLNVCDDGDATSAGHRTPGYGLVGMAERATLLGGTLSAGPDVQGGWTVTAVLPKSGAGR